MSQVAVGSDQNSGLKLLWSCQHFWRWRLKCNEIPAKSAKISSCYDRRKSLAQPGKNKGDCKKNAKFVVTVASILADVVNLNFEELFNFILRIQFIHIFAKVFATIFLEWAPMPNYWEKVFPKNMNTLYGVITRLLIQSCKDRRGMGGRGASILVERYLIGKKIVGLKKSRPNF